MIIRFITRFFFGIIKKIFILVLIVVVLIWYFFFKGKDVNFDWESIKGKVYNDYMKGVQVEVLPNNKGHYEINDDMKKQIDIWVQANNLNEYGDPKNSVYIGGTPLFNESTGESVDVYDYIISNNPQLLELLK